MGGAHGNDRRPTHDLVHGGLGVDQLIHVFDFGKPVGPDLSIQLVLNLLHDLGVVEHVDNGPEQRRLERFHSR